MNIRILVLALTVSLVTAPGAVGQGVVVDQGAFSVRLRGQAVGTEDFVIRRAGMGREDAVFASGVVRTRIGTATQEVKPLLRASPPDWSAVSYQVDVTGPDAIDVRISRTGRRYVATIRSEIGDEDREFQAQANTRVVELGVAHHYYFLRDVREGVAVHVLEPRSRRQVTLTSSAPSDVDLTLGPSLVSARRVQFDSDQGDLRIVWFDRQGRVLRVEIPSLGYVAERTDLVG